ncbi:unnamed protein product [Candidula unifasciata]|uniref:G-protein coupled receptors family 1 profile domain-containing protein n=1 Tax=Candidula unifasciata TaxID=100452 RepID=A0A8S3Z3V9_9EUPU|nr:unnamed protein product [Candidula unifasciata]
MRGRNSVNTTRMPHLLLSQADLCVVQIVNHLVLSGAVCLLGIVANIINIIIFYKLGLQDTVNISLFAISLSDLCSLVTLEWVNINLNPFMDRADVPFEPMDIQYLTGGWPHACFARITIWITIIVTAERFCCVAFPLNVKQLFNPRTIKITVCVVYAAMFVLLMPLYGGLYFGEKFISSRNQTRVGLMYRDKGQHLEHLEFKLYAIIEIATFIIIIVLTTLLVVSLKRRSAWRATLTTVGQRDNAVRIRDRRRLKLVTLVAMMVIICFSPAFVMYFATFFLPGFSLTGKYSIMFNVLWSFTFLAEAINSSVNIFIFCKMSSKFRRALRKLFSICQRF